MPKQSFLSKTAVVSIVLTVCAIAGVIATVLLFKYLPSRLATTKTPPLMRLPKNLLPHSYKVILQPHLYTQVIEEENATSANQTLHFDGMSVVNFHCIEKTQTICLHSKELWITETPIVMNQKKNMSMKVTQTVFRNDQSDFMEVLLEEPLEKGEDYSLKLTFWGQMSATPAGLYVSVYEEGDNEGNENTIR